MAWSSSRVPDREGSHHRSRGFLRASYLFDKARRLHPFNTVEQFRSICRGYVESGEAYDRPPLHLFCEHGFADVVKMFITAGADVNEAEFNGSYPLSIAVRQQHDDIVNLLLEAGADVKRVAIPFQEMIERGQVTTCLGRAIVDNNLPIVRLLVEKGRVDPNDRVGGFVDGRTTSMCFDNAFVWAVRLKHKDIAAYLAPLTDMGLLKSHFWLNVVLRYQPSAVTDILIPFSAAAKFDWWHAPGYPSGGTPFEEYCKTDGLSDHLASLHILLASRGDRQPRADFAERLVNQRAIMDRRLKFVLDTFPEQRTPELLVALCATAPIWLSKGEVNTFTIGLHTVFESLLPLAANATIVHTSNHPLLRIIDMKWVDLLRVAIPSIYPITTQIGLPQCDTFHYACSVGDLDVIRCLLDLGASVTERQSTSGWLPLNTYVKSCPRELRVDVIELLLTRSIDAGLQVTGRELRPILDHLIMYGPQSVCLWIVRQKIPLDYVGCMLDMCLTDVRHIGRTEIAARVCLLLSLHKTGELDLSAARHHIDPTSGRTLLHCACICNSVSMVYAVLEFGVDATIRDTRGRLALAIWSSCPDRVFYMLVKAGGYVYHLDRTIFKNASRRRKEVLQAIGDRTKIWAGLRENYPGLPEDVVRSIVLQL